MNKLIFILLIAFSFNAFSRIEVGDELTTTEDIKFYPTDYNGAFAVINWFTENPVLEEGYTFVVTDVTETCETKTIHGKYFKFCHRYLDLDSENCGINEQSAVERGSSSSFSMNFRVEDGVCKIRTRETDNDAGMFRKVSKDLLDKRSPVNSYFVIHR